MGLDQKEGTSFNLPEKKITDKKNFIIYIITGILSISSLIFGYASYQATYFKDMEIKNLKAQLDNANTKLLRIDILENQVKTLEASLASKNTSKSKVDKQKKGSVKKIAPSKKSIKKLNKKIVKTKEKKLLKK